MKCKCNESSANTQRKCNETASLRKKRLTKPTVFIVNIYNQATYVKVCETVAEMDTDAVGT